MPMSDRLKQAQERWTDIKLDWGLRDSPDDVEVRLAAVVRWLDSASSDRTVPLRATQILLLDPEAPGASRRAVVRHVYKALGTLLDLEHVPHQNPRVEELPTAPPGALLVLTDAQREALTTPLQLTPVDVGAPPLPAAPGGYWLYRVGPR